MKRTSLAVLMIALALVALAAPMAYAQAPAPKVTINGLIDQVGTWASNVHNYSGLFNRKDSQWYARTRGRFDIIGEVGKAKGVFGIEIDSTWGQTGSADAAIPSGASQAFGTTSSFDLNTDTNPSVEVKWLYTEFPMPLIPVPTTVRLGAQPSGTAATYKLASYFNGDFAGVNAVITATPAVKLQATYVAVEEGLTGTETRTGYATLPNTFPSIQDRGDDYAYIFSTEITPFKGLDIKPMFSGFHAQGTTNGSARAGRGGINTSTAFSPAANHVGGITEARYTVGLDARLRIGPFSLDPTVHYQFGHRRVITPAGACTTGVQFSCTGAVPGQRVKADLDAWLFDLRAGFQLGPLLLEAVGVYTTGNKARNSTLETVHYYQPLSTDTGYLADWGTQLTSLGIDYLSAQNEGARFVAYPGNQIGWDKYGRAQVGVKATYAITPTLSAMAGINAHWTAEKVDRNGTPTAGAGILPLFTGAQTRDNSRFIGTELMALISWQLAPGVTWANAAGYMFSGPALDGITDSSTAAPGYGRYAKDTAIFTSRVRFTF